MISRHAQRLLRFHHAHYQTQDFWNFRTAIYQIAEKNGLAAVGRDNGEAAGLGSDIPWRNLVVKNRKQFQQLFVAAVDVSNDVERPMLVLKVVPQRLEFDF